MGSSRKKPSKAKARFSKKDVGTVYMCLRLPGQVRPAKLLDVRKAQNKSSSQECYVHFLGLDNRLDRWVPAEDIEQEATEEQVKEAVPNLGSKSKKRVKELPKPSSCKKPKLQLASSEKSSSSLGRGVSHDHEHQVRNINRIQFGKYEIDCWYYSPYPIQPCDKLYVCERTFKYMTTASAYKKHIESCQVKEPPGREIYKDVEKQLSVYEIDGRVQTLYGQNLCLFGKLFIEHKTLTYDPDPFQFYLLVERDNEGFHPVGYFSKERNSPELYNLACILILPPFQRKGYGKFIISLSYEISKKDKVLGSPEKPLSDLGKLSYRSYWSYVLLDLIDQTAEDDVDSLIPQNMAKQTSIKVEDILSTLQHLQMIKHLKGQFVVHISRSRVKEMLSEFNERHFADNFCKRELLKY